MCLSSGSNLSSSLWIDIHSKISWFDMNDGSLKKIKPYTPLHLGKK